MRHHDLDRRRQQATRQPAPARRTSNRAVIVLAVSAVALAAAIALVACSGVAPAITRAITSSAGQPDPDDGAGSMTDGRFGTADGVLDENRFTVDDVELPGIANLDPDLLEAVRQATEAAADDDITLFISSGWRSTAYQQHLLDEAILRYGSEEAARQVVATPEGSSHTRGAAVDIGATDADYWLIEHGSAFGLCQTYANEIWHFELATTPGGECPELLPDAG
ncbi:M15 family metallopeptidase [Plantibacter sp. VKM Ac-2880]|uniref:M15 family metallopeptidase n=1 Tax=Plantibacter sp. VKM Ac-2880 TaxID=2783827 RepID=UPI00188FAC64|nr:M15 family metallopeptidase [Plantibacter sp. VKM Ac-2880]MBF4570449.1 M15 family metallopeptidase [Plantibacter sp. VKM Ac-2880]